MLLPLRLRRSRARGSRLVSPNGLPVVCVSRGTRWGNPFVASSGLLRGWSVEQFEAALLDGELGFTVEDVRQELRGKNLACWCPPGEPCHADVLLRIANGRLRRAR